MNIKRGLATLAIAALSLTSLAACGSDTAQDEEKPDSLVVLVLRRGRRGQSPGHGRRAAKAFEKETGVKINFERKSFTQIAQNGSQFLNSDEAPDLMESNRRATAPPACSPPWACSPTSATMSSSTAGTRR